MRGLLLVVGALAIAAPSAWAQNCNMLNNVIYCDDGSSGNRVGGTTFWNANPRTDRVDGRVDDRDPGTAAGGERRSGRVTSDEFRPYDQYRAGAPSTSQGTTTYLNDGRVCSRIGASVYCQ